MKVIKISSDIISRYFYRQTPNNECIWKGNKYVADDDNLVECDWWVVFEKLKAKTTSLCPDKNTIFITGEPPDMKTYNQSFINQFNTILTCHTDLKHPHVVTSQQAIPWMLSIYKNKNDNVPYNYNSFSADKNFKKIKLISIISSSKQNTLGHKKRYKFVQSLKNHFGAYIDIFGSGINKIPDKWEGINPYKYHIAIENESIPNYWTEKLADTFLANTYPIYHGCINIYDYFPKTSLSIINIDKIEKSIKQIEKIIHDNTFEKSQKHILKAKEMILNKYNFFEVIYQLIASKPIKDKVSVTLRPEESFSWKSRLISVKNKFSGHI